MTSRSPTTVIVAVLLLLLALDVGSYLVLVKPGLIITYGNPPPPRYRPGGRFADAVFWPLEQVYRKIQRAAWERQLISWE